MHGDIPDVLAAIIMLIALLPWWGGVVVAVIAGFAVRAWWRKRRATQTAQRIAEGGAQGTVIINVGSNAPGSGGASAVDSAQQERQ